MINNEELPIGFSMALSQHLDALDHFSHLSKEERQQVINKARTKHSHEAMQSYVENMFKN